MKPYWISAILIASQFFPHAVLSDEWHYPDVATNHIYAPAIYELSSQGVLEGYEDGNFHVDQLVNRVEALKMILAAFEIESTGTSKEVAFADLVETEWYMTYVETALELGIMQGHDDGTFAPLDPVNRAEIMKMVTLAKELKVDVNPLDPWYTAYLNLGVSQGLLVPNANQDYLPSANMTRGELADLLLRMENNVYTGAVEYGVASYYGYSMEGANTASGEKLTVNGFQTAHKTLPFGTMIRVINVETDEYVDVKVVDRGPFTPGRVVDLTPAAFEAIGSLGSGLLKVRVEVLK